MNLYGNNKAKMHYKIYMFVLPDNIFDIFEYLSKIDIHVRNPLFSTLFAKRKCRY